MDKNRENQCREIIERASARSNNVLNVFKKDADVKMINQLGKLYGKEVSKEEAKEFIKFSDRFIKQSITNNRCNQDINLIENIGWKYVEMLEKEI